MTTEKSNPRTGNNAMTVGLAAVAGVGFSLMTVALAIGVINGNSADENTIRLVFTGGAALFVVGLIAWGAVVRPWENFDDINVPQYHGHHHEHTAHNDGVGDHTDAE